MYTTGIILSTYLKLLVDILIIFFNIYTSTLASQQAAMLAQVSFVISELSFRPNLTYFGILVTPQNVSNHGL